MRALLLLPAILTLPVMASAADKNTGSGSAKQQVTTDLVLSIDLVQPLASWAGPVKVVHFDAKFVISGTVKWVERPSVIARGSNQAFAVHSPAQLGLSGWKRGDEICLRLTRIREGAETSWRMSAMKPDAGCTGGAVSR